MVFLFDVGNVVMLGLEVVCFLDIFVYVDGYWCVLYF